MNKNGTKPTRWPGIIALVMSFIGFAGSVGGAIFILSIQANVSGEPVWPLPGLVLLDWALLGVFGFICACFCFLRRSVNWLRAFWFCSGGLLPLIILRAFSIGPYVMIVFLISLISGILLAIQKEPKWLLSFASLLLGAICNLGLLLLMITLGNPNY